MFNHTNAKTSKLRGVKTVNRNKLVQTGYQHNGQLLKKKWSNLFSSMTAPNIIQRMVDYPCFCMFMHIPHITWQNNQYSTVLPFLLQYACSMIAPRLANVPDSINIQLVICY